MCNNIAVKDLIVADIKGFENIEITGTVYEINGVLTVEGYALEHYDIKEVYRKDPSNNYKRIYNYNRGKSDIDNYADQCDKCKTCKLVIKDQGSSELTDTSYHCSYHDNQMIVQFCGYENECPKYEEEDPHD